MKIATFNVNGVNGRLPVLLHWLKMTRPHVVCLQELKAPDERFPAAAIAELGYQASWQGQKSWNGVAILSRCGEIHETCRGLPGDPSDQQSRYLEAAINGVLVAALYLPNGNPRPGPKFDYKLAWMERLIARAGELIARAGELIAGSLPVVLAGDFNVIPTERDVYKPERWLDDALFAPEVRQLFARLLEQGWADTLRDRHPDATIYTFWDYFRNAWARNAGLRIDHLLVSPALHVRVRGAQVDSFVRGWDKASDHAPVWMELDD